MERKMKVTVLVEERLLIATKRLVGKGRYRSLDECVNEALHTLLIQEGRRGLGKEMEMASRDEMFLADIQRTMEDFKYADAETAKGMKEFLR